MNLNPIVEQVTRRIRERSAPTRERYAELREDGEAIEEILAAGAAKARALAAPVVEDVCQAMGVGPPSGAGSLVTGSGAEHRSVGGAA